MSPQSNTTTPSNSPRKDAERPPPKVTPRIPRSVAGSVNLTYLRTLISAKNKHEFVQCEADVFLSHYLPFKPTEAQIERCIKALAEFKKMPLWIRGTGDDNKDRFAELTRGRNSELKTFTPLARIFQVISKQELKGRTSNMFAFQNRPNGYLTSDINGANHKIDACLTWAKGRPKPEGQKSPDPALHMTKIVAPIEYKIRVDKKRVTENRSQLLSAVHHIMHDDARRTWVYGISIEGDRVSVWYYSRSHCAKATSFSFTKEPKLLLSVLISLAFGTLEELGYDPRVTLTQEHRYLYEVQNPHTKRPLYFRTVESLVEPREIRMTGRMARIWKVKRVISKRSPEPTKNAPDMVLKDVWLDATMPTEAEIQRSLFDTIREFARLPDWRSDPKVKAFTEDVLAILSTYLKDDKFKELFLCVMYEHTGSSTKPVAMPSWNRTDLFTPIPEEKLNSYSLSIQTQRSGHPNQPTTPDPFSEKIATPTRYFIPKRRCFFVYEHVCKCVHDLQTLGEVVDVLRQTLIALQLMYCAGWVHRDISTGNILAYPTESGGWDLKLSDLEYAKKFPPNSGSPDPKTGTPFFMPVEIEIGEYFYQPTPTTVASISRYQLRTVAKVVKTPLVYNFQHDLESLWWVILWMITMRVEHNASEQFGKAYFQVSVNVGMERKALLRDGFDEDFKAIVRPELEAFTIHVPEMGSILVSRYWNIGSSGEILTDSAYGASHQIFHGFFEELIAERSQWAPVKVNPMQHPTLKRSREAMENEGDNEEQTESSPTPRPKVPLPLIKSQKSDAHEAPSTKRARRTDRSP